MTWQFQSASGAFQENREQWDRLNSERGAHILLDSLFVECLLRHFGEPDVLLGTQSEGTGAMVLVRRKSPALWETFQPSQAPLGLFVAGRNVDIPETFRSLVQSLPGYALLISLLHLDPAYLPPAMAGSGNIDKLDYIRTASIPLQGTFEDYWQSREGRLRKNNDRLRRRIAEKGLKLEFVAVREPAEIAEAIREYGLLESTGWKAQQGTAVTADNEQGKFYRDLLESFCARGEGAVYQLRIDGKLVASDICLMREKTIVLLKTSYAEEYSVYSPAFLLREDVVRQLYVEGVVKNYEFYGPLMDYQLRWTNDVRTLYHLTCYRHSWVKPLRKLAKRFA
jgi:CelD/BcsL family acetyltransferase involved in cellulose biosynthesis